jgi:hypothetical protein
MYNTYYRYIFMEQTQGFCKNVCVSEGSESKLDMILILMDTSDSLLSDWF